MLKFLLMAALCTVGFAAAETRSARANVVCGGYYSTTLGPARMCTAGIPSALLNVTAHERQQASEWCWAASIAGIFGYYGHPVKQVDIVKQAYGLPFNIPASPELLVKSLNRLWIDEYGRVFRVRATMFHTTWINAANDLAADRPLIIGSLGHAMIMTASTYLRYSNGGGIIESVEVRDPWPDNPQRRALTAQEMAGVVVLIRIVVD